MVQLVRRFLADRSGASAIEYAAILILIAVVLFVATKTISAEIAVIYGSIEASFE